MKFIVLFLAFSLFLHSEEFSEEGFHECTRLKNARIELKHRDGSGIGYNQGYSTVSLFYAPYVTTVFPFVDGRFHVFNNGRYAANAGFGLRGLLYERFSFGFNAYYDFRKSRVLRLHQAAMGLEFLTKNTGVFINGYLPFGEKRFDNPREFDHFSGRLLYVSQKRKAALAHIDALVRYTIRKNEILSASPSIGGYYLAKRSKSSKRLGNAFGVKGEFSLHFFDVFSVGAYASYDKIFKTRVEGFARLTLPLGLQKCKKPKSKCKTLNTFVRKNVQRDEIIPIEDKTVFFPLINSATNEPYLFSFVSNASQSDGTFESPFTDISTAIANSNPRDVVYVFPGTGQVYNERVILKDWMIFQGSGNSFVLEDVTIPALTDNMPSVNAGISSFGKLTLANNNIVNGFILGQTNSGGDIIVGDGIQNATIQNCIIRRSLPSQAIQITGSGRITVTDCRVESSLAGGIGFQITATGDTKFDIQRNNLLRCIINGSTFNCCTRFRDNVTSLGYTLQNMTVESPNGVQSGVESINQGTGTFTNVIFTTESCFSN